VHNATATRQQLAKCQPNSAHYITTCHTDAWDSWASQPNNRMRAQIQAAATLPRDGVDSYALGRMLISDDV
jgi:hypothetical protein